MTPHTSIAQGQGPPQQAELGCAWAASLAQLFREAEKTQADVVSS